MDAQNKTTRNRRKRDRLIDREGTLSQRLKTNRRLKNHALLVDDDLRETAHALNGIEGFLVKALNALDRENLLPEEVESLATDFTVHREMEYLEDTLGSLKRRLQVIASTLPR